MKYIKINENGIHIVFGITDKNQIKLLHFSKAEFDENDICKFGKECKAEDLVRKEQFIDEAFQLVQVNLAGYNRPYEKHGNKHICTIPARRRQILELSCRFRCMDRFQRSIYGKGDTDQSL